MSKFYRLTQPFPFYGEDSKITNIPTGTYVAPADEYRIKGDAKPGLYEFMTPGLVRYGCDQSVIDANPDFFKEVDEVLFRRQETVVAFIEVIQELKDFYGNVDTSIIQEAIRQCDVPESDDVKKEPSLYDEILRKLKELEEEGKKAAPFPYVPYTPQPLPYIPQQPLIPQTPWQPQQPWDTSPYRWTCSTCGKTDGGACWNTACPHRIHVTYSNTNTNSTNNH